MRYPIQSVEVGEFKPSLELFSEDEDSLVPKGNVRIAYFVGNARMAVIGGTTGLLAVTESVGQLAQIYGTVLRDVPEQEGKHFRQLME